MVIFITSSLKHVHAIRGVGYTYTRTNRQIQPGNLLRLSLKKREKRPHAVNRHFRAKLFIIMSETLQAGCWSTAAVPNHWSPSRSWEFGNPPWLLFYKLESSNCLILMALNGKCESFPFRSVNDQKSEHRWSDYIIQLLSDTKPWDLPLAIRKPEKKSSLGLIHQFVCSHLPGYV